jgi:hypothetical protein
MGGEVVRLGATGAALRALDCSGLPRWLPTLFFTVAAEPQGRRGRAGGA